MKRIPKYITHIVGIDEVGRGPLAGPVSVGVFCMPRNTKLSKEITDSKKLSPKKREILTQQLKQLQKENKCSFCVVSLSSQKIDEKGIAVCIRAALAQGLKKIGVAPKSTYIYLDGGLKAPQEYIHQETIIKGDSLVPVIGAASIVAKVTRDMYMTRIAKKYSHYGFDVHKGYGTRAHCEAIQKYGLSKEHRSSFIHFI